MAVGQHRKLDGALGHDFDNGDQVAPPQAGQPSAGPHAARSVNYAVISRIRHHHRPQPLKGCRDCTQGTSCCCCRARGRRSRTEGCARPAGHPALEGPHEHPSCAVSNRNLQSYPCMRKRGWSWEDGGAPVREKAPAMPPAMSLWKGSLGGILAPSRYSTPSAQDAQSIQPSTMLASLTCKFNDTPCSQGNAA